MEFSEFRDNEELSMFTGLFIMVQVFLHLALSGKVVLIVAVLLMKPFQLYKSINPVHKAIVKQ